MFERILVPLDGSGFSARALPYAVEIARRFGAELFLLQVVPPTAPPTAIRSAAGQSRIAVEKALQQAHDDEKRNMTRARRYLREKLREVTAHGVKGSYHIEVGSPAESILEFCKKESVGLVVMTTHGRGGFKRAILGSVADKLIRDPSFPVLAVRPRTLPKE